ncbi:DUF1700 domain-containing protein [Listeria booriae]|uniref:DUF1700 domain-containing protein n=1 Tax=Listeria booriae TaxID=1552123 RepID=UPI0016256633|nr:DUF1700 domain-containing protein [Listeria booriae]MBC2263926.1 DUF1700 domain-containing protein [Listeria booriae]
MNRQEFFRALEEGFATLDIEERESLLADYEEHIQISMASGKTEEEALAHIGDPRHIVASYFEENRLDAALHGLDDENSRKRIQWKALFSTLWQIIILVLSALFILFSGIAIIVYIFNWISIGQVIVYQLFLCCVLIGIALLLSSLLASTWRQFITRKGASQ